MPIGYRPVPDLSRAPIGVIDDVSVSGNSVNVSGWARSRHGRIDPVHIYVGNAGAALHGRQVPSDVGAAYPSAGWSAWLLGEIAAPPGQSNVCVYAINNGDGGNTLIGCGRSLSRTILARPSAISSPSVPPRARSWWADGSRSRHGPTRSPCTCLRRWCWPSGFWPMFRGATSARLSGSAIATASRRRFCGRGSHNVCVYPINDNGGGARTSSWAVEASLSLTDAKEGRPGIRSPLLRVCVQNRSGLLRSGDKERGRPGWTGARPRRPRTRFKFRTLLRGRGATGLARGEKYCSVDTAPTRSGFVPVRRKDFSCDVVPRECVAGPVTLYVPKGAPVLSR